MINDQGRYRCQAINSKHTELASVETILIVKRKFEKILMKI